MNAHLRSGGLMVMAGGTGGHVMPALAVSESLIRLGVTVNWLGTPNSMEEKIVKQANIPFEAIPIKPLRVRGVIRKLSMPFNILCAMFFAYKVLRKYRPQAVLGMGGFVAGPGGLVASMSRTPLIVHEQNSVVGLTNKCLAFFASRVLTGFPSVVGLPRHHWTGNPVRNSIAKIASPEERFVGRVGMVRVLVIGGSQGAVIFNQVLPGIFSEKLSKDIEVWHQCGQHAIKDIEEKYASAGIQYQVSPFIQDMAAAYEWCDLVICRSGAMTVSEICLVGVVAIFVPFPSAVDDHQTANANYLVKNNAAYLVDQNQLSDGDWWNDIRQFKQDRKLLMRMAIAARQLGKPHATQEVTDICMEVINA